MDLYITDELISRPKRKVDHRLESNAMRELAAHMADAAEAVLPRLVSVAMEATGGTAGGLSLYEPGAGPGPGVLRWRHVAGDLARFENATTPRDYSPGGVALDHGDVVLCKHPERYYRWMAAANIVVPEVLVVPMFAGGGEPIGTLWLVAGHAGQFSAEHARIAGQLARFVAVALGAQFERDRLRHALDEQELVAREMGHRLKNVYAVTESMIRVTAKGAESPTAMAEALTGRLHALAEAQALVRRKGPSETAHQRSLHDLLGAVIHALDVGSVEERGFSVEGPEVPCGEHGTNGIALLTHELATNALKYGALKQGAGRVTIRWHRDGDRVVLVWEERGGPPVEAPPARSGFGSVLLQRTIERQFGGAVTQEWLPQGLRVTMEIPEARLAM